MDFGCIFRIYDLFLWKVSRRSIVVFITLIEQKMLININLHLVYLILARCRFFLYNNIRLVYGYYFYDFSYIGSCRAYIYNVS